jgi:hypothetical protein
MSQTPSHANDAVVNIDAIIMDSTTQARGMNRSQVSEYAELMQDGIVFPPIVVFQDEEYQLWLADGFHRVAAAVQGGFTKINAVIFAGSQREAILYSLGPANNAHGLALTRQERRERVIKMLQDDEWCKWSDREIAKHCGVSHPTVAQIRRDTGKVSSERVGADGRTQFVKHWAQLHEQSFWQKVTAVGLKDQPVLGMLQKGAAHLTDLALTKDQTWHKLNQLAIEHHSRTWAKDDYVKHSTGYFGKVMGVVPDYLSVLNFSTGMESAWMYRDCTKSTHDEWQASINQPIESEFHYRQVCHTWAKCTIWGFNQMGVLEPSMHSLPEGKQVEFVRAFQSGNKLFAEVNWGGSPTRIPLNAIRAGEPPQYDNPFSEGDRVVLKTTENKKNWRSGTVRYLKGNDCGVFFDASKTTHYYDWQSLIREEDFIDDSEADSPTITEGQTVKAPSGQTGTVTAVSGNMVTVETANGQHSYRDRNLTVIDDEQPSDHYTSELVAEIMPSMKRILNYADGNTGPDQKLASEILNLMRWLDDVHGVLLEELETEPDGSH